ncbi:MAG: hypothetical protein GY710_26215 [Desulfobacteraceae bacterium]|nr:hypothetical protein [Desulfobacteraceae bacterium]
MKNPFLKKSQVAIKPFGIFVSYPSSSFLFYQTIRKDRIMPEYIARDYSQRIEAIQYTDTQSAKQIKEMLDRFPAQVEIGIGKLLINSEPVKIGQYVSTTWTGISVNDAQIIKSRFKPIQVQHELV